MRKIGKGLAAAAVMAALAGGSVVALAQGGPGYGPMGYGPGFMHGQGGYGMMGGGWGGQGAVDPAARLDALKAKLAIRPDQTAAWNAYSKAVTDGMTQLQAIRNGIDVDKLRTMSWTDHQALMGKIHDQRAAVFTSIQSARTSLVAVLDDTQKSELTAFRHAAFGPGRGGFGPGHGPGMGGYGRGMMGGSGPGFGPGMMGGRGPMMWGGGPDGL